MSLDQLAAAYLKKAIVRIQMLEFLIAKEAWSDVVREAQECVELCLKAQLRMVGIDPPKIHDVSRVLRDSKEKLPAIVAENLEKICHISFKMRRDRELSFYGDVDVIPTESYSREDALTAFSEARWIVSLVTGNGSEDSQFQK